MRTVFFTRRPDSRSDRLSHESNERLQFKPMENYDLVIIGAGLAGFQCARLLGNRGLAVLLVDRKETLDVSIHTTGIFVRRTLEDFDIPADCLGPVVRHVSLYSPARRRMDLVSSHA